MQSDQAALVLARLIQTGFAAELPEALPPEWQAAYNAVRAVPASLLYQRRQAFADAIEDHPDAELMHHDLRAACEQLEIISMDQLRVYSAWETLEPPPPQQAVVEGAFTRPSLNLIVGAPGAKKTWLALESRRQRSQWRTMAGSSDYSHASPHSG
jgi:hypothetical protein